MQNCGKSRQVGTLEHRQTKDSFSKDKQQLAQLQQDLARLDGFAKAIKHQMQDRMKFMSSKNALRHDATLTKLDKVREGLREKMHALQIRR